MQLIHKFKLIQIFILFFILFYFLNIKYNFKIKDNDIKNKYYYDFKNNKIPSNKLNKYLEYINNSKNGIIMYKQNLIKSKFPKVTIVISMYNREDYINSTLKSAQNQRMKDLEIIVVDDFSSDNSIKYVEEAQKLDSRIFLIKNNKRKGTLFSKSIGVLYAKSKYIQSLDSDDMICFENYTEILYEESEIGNYDYIVCDYIIINLRQKTIFFKKYFNNVILWQKFIKTEIYKNIIYKIGNNILNKGIIQLDDNFIDIFLKGFYYKHLNIVGIFHFIHYKNHQWETKFNNNEDKNKFCEELLDTIDALYDVLENDRKSKLYSYGELNTLFIKTKCFIIKNIRGKIIKVFLKFYKSKFFNNNEKNYIRYLLRIIGIIIKYK